MPDDDEQLVDERDWDADKRDFIAEGRDDIADAREADADARESAADERDAALNDRERRLNIRSAVLRLPPENTARPDANDRADARRERSADRAAATAARDEANKRRESSGPATGLAMAFAGIASYLYEADNLDQVLTRIVETAVSTIPGCDMASITVRGEGGAFRTLANTRAAAVDADICQYEAGEGPCLDAFDTAVVYTPSLPDPRWPALSDRPAASGVQSALSYRLTASRRAAEDPLAGSLNNYARVPDAFDVEAQEIGFILAAHAAVAARAHSQREELEALGHGLFQALSSRDVIGQAKGMLMERLRVSPEDAFDLLRQTSQQLNVKLREVANTLTTTRRLLPSDQTLTPAAPAGPPA